MLLFSVNLEIIIIHSNVLLMMLALNLVLVTFWFPCLGTTVNVINLFSNVPVRREYCSKSRSYELQKIEKVIKVLAIINTKLRVTLVHNKCLIWQKTESYTIRDSLMQAYPHNMIKNLIDRVHTYEDVSILILNCHLLV